MINAIAGLYWYARLVYCFWICNRFTSVRHSYYIYDPLHRSSTALMYLEVLNILLSQDIAVSFIGPSDVPGPAQSRKLGQAELWMWLCMAFGLAQISEKPKPAAQAVFFLQLSRGFFLLFFFFNYCCLVIRLWYVTLTVMSVTCWTSSHLLWYISFFFE